MVLPLDSIVALEFYKGERYNIYTALKIYVGWWDIKYGSGFTQTLIQDQHFIC
jgi:hypothetical protein